MTGNERNRQVVENVWNAIKAKDMDELDQFLHALAVADKP